MQYSLTFNGGTTRYLFNTLFEGIGEYYPLQNTVIVTDSNIATLYPEAFKAFKGVIIIKAGEKHKDIDSLQYIIQRLLELKVHRGNNILGVGGGMVTDITGFAASMYMRGLNFGYVPTTLLGMVDAAIGGKNGINLGLQKNLLGTFKQPGLILFDQHFLDTLPAEEWSNGFAEIIKYACIFDKALFDELLEHDINYYRTNHAATTALVARCADWKNKTVLSDEYEKGIRKLLNFGHTTGHAFETICRIPHGCAVALGMLVATQLSVDNGLEAEVYSQLKQLLSQYGLPVHIHADANELVEVLSMDKKRDDAGIDYILLETKGKGIISHVAFDVIKRGLEVFIK